MLADFKKFRFWGIPLACAMAFYAEMIMFGGTMPALLFWPLLCVPPALAVTGIAQAYSLHNRRRKYFGKRLIALREHVNTLLEIKPASDLLLNLRRKVIQSYKQVQEQSYRQNQASLNALEFQVLEILASKSFWFDKMDSHAPVKIIEHMQPEPPTLKIASA